MKYYKIWALCIKNASWFMVLVGIVVHGVTERRNSEGLKKVKNWSVWSMDIF